MLIYWFLPMIIFLGIVTSYEDIKFGKIRNKWIFMAIIYAFAVYLYLFLFNNEYQSNLDILNLVINASSALIIAFFMWHIKLWKAGDAKLFFAFVTLMGASLHKPYSFIYILMNTFVPIFIFFIAYIALKTSNKEKFRYLKRSFNTRTLVNIMLLIFSVPWLIRLSLSFVGFRANIYLPLLLVFLLYHIFDNILKIKISYIAVLVALARLVFDRSIYSLNFAYEFAMLFLLFIVMRVFIVSIGSAYFSEETSFSQMKPGIVPAENIFKFKEGYFKRMNGFSIIRYGGSKIGTPLFKNPDEGLSKRDIRLLKSLQKKLPFKTLKIQTTMPFAPFLLTGVLLTIIFDYFRIFV